MNQLADYLYTPNAAQREKIIRSAKFPRKTAIIPYSKAKRAISGFLTANSGDLSYFDVELRHLQSRLQTEPDGWMRDELKRNIDAIEEFKKAFKRLRLKRYEFVSAPKDLSMTLERVRVNARLDASVMETDKEENSHAGGCVIFAAAGDQSRKNLAERLKAVTALVHWELEHAGGNITPLPRLCMSFDVFGSTLTKAPTAIDRLRNNIRSSCQEAAGRWDNVAPPAGYDGPDWR